MTPLDFRFVAKAYFVAKEHEAFQFLLRMETNIDFNIHECDIYYLDVGIADFTHTHGFDLAI